MFFSKSSISNLLYNTYRMFDIAIDDEVIHNALLDINFTDPKVEALKATWVTVNTAVEDHKKAIEDQRKAKFLFLETIRESNATYMTHLKYARSICHIDQERWTKLGLGLPRKRKLNDRLIEASVFYSNILEDALIVTAFDEKYGQTTEALEDGKKAMEMVNTGKEEYITAIGNCQAKKADRDVMLKQLGSDAAGFHAVLRRALKNNLQHLEKVNIKVYSPGYKKKKTEEPPAEGPTGTDPQTTGPNAQTSQPPDPNTSL